MKVGELFLDISLKGGNKVVSALSGVKNWLTDVSSSGLAAKAAILAAVYALERMTAASGKFGNEITNFSLLTGIDTTKIQQWSEYMRKSGATAEDATSSLLAAQKTATQIQTGQGVPFGLALISKSTKTNLLEHLNDPLFFADKVREYLRTTKDNTALANEAALSVGFTPGAISASRKNGEDIYKIAGGNVASPNEVKRLTQVNQEWSNFEKSLSRLRDMLTSKWGLPIIHELNVLLTMVKDLAFWLDKSTKSLTSFRGLLEPIFGKAPAPGKAGMVEKESEASKKARNFLQGIFGAPPMGEHIVPKVKHTTTQKPVKTSQNNTNINVYQTGIENSHDSVSEFKAEIAKAAYSISTLGTVA